MAISGCDCCWLASWLGILDPRTLQDDVMLCFNRGLLLQARFFFARARPEPFFGILNGTATGGRRLLSRAEIPVAF